MENSTLLFLLKEEINLAFYAWDAQQPPRAGLHASSVLESDADFCTRQHVLAEQFPNERQAKEQYLPSLQKFVHGWAIHKKLQEEIFMRTGLVVLSEDDGGWASLLKPELDLTHIDPQTDIHFSPDVIIKYGELTLPVEIKGINHEDFAGQEELYKRDFAHGHLYVDGYCYEKVQDARQGVAGATLTEAAARNKSIRSAIPQLNLYMHLLGLTEAPNNRGIIFAEDKNTQKFEMWIHEYDHELSIQPIDRAMHVKFMNAAYKQDGILPKRICHSITDSRAKRCPFRAACFKEGR